jgi:hypothetical protein
MDWELYEAEKLLDWMLPRQRRLLRTLVRAQELNAMQLRRSARQRLRNGGVRDKAGGEAARDLKAYIQPLVRHLSKVTGAEPAQVAAGKVREEADRKARRARERGG